MGKTVTYGIGLKKADVIKEGVNYYIQQYNQYLQSNKKVKASGFILELLEWLTLDNDDLDQSENRFKNALKIAIKYCSGIIPDLSEHRDLLHRSFKGLSQGYSLLRYYDLALEFGRKTLDLLLAQTDETQPKVYLQEAYRNLGSIYFTKSMDKIQSRYSDFEHAIQYYELERSVILSMTMADILENPEEDDIKRLLQSCYFNIGVMQSKIESRYPDGESNLRRAISLARQIRDPVSEKTAWWELGNLFKRQKQYGLVKECQKEEYLLIQKHDFAEDNFFCYEERMKLHLFLGEYNAFNQIYAESVQNCDPPSKAYKDIWELVTGIQGMKSELDKLISKGDLNAPIASNYLDYIETLQEHKLHRLVIKTVDSSLPSLLNTRDFNHLTFALFLYYKLGSMWSLRESLQEDYFKTSNEAFDYVEANLVDSPLNQLQLTIDIFKLRVRFHEYFDQTFQMESCKQLLNDTIKEEKLMRQKLANNYQMDIDFPEHARITPAIHKAIRRRIKVKIYLEPKPIEFTVQYEHTPETVKKLMNNIATRCWINYGIEPIFSHMRTLDHDIFPEDYIINILKEDNQLVEGFVKEIERKSPLLTYLNACDRLGCKIRRKNEIGLSKQTLTHLSFAGLHITADQIQPLQQVIKNCVSLQYLSLASNSLRDQDVEQLLESANKRLGELDLCNNSLTYKCLESIQKLQLRALLLSSNPIGSDVFISLPLFLDTIPSLKQLSMKDTNIGRSLALTDSIISLYETTSVVQVANLGLDISNNHFESDMLQNATLLISRIKRISKIELSSITSDSDWHNFHLLSDLPKLSDLCFKHSTKTIQLCHLRGFFSAKTRLMHLDLTSCNLSSENMMTLSKCLDPVLKLRRLTLNSNPKIGDEGLRHLNNIVVQSKIDILDVSNCNISLLSKELLSRWKDYVRQLDITENPKLYTNSLEDLFMPTAHSTAMIKLNEFNQKSEHVSNLLAYQPIANLPSSPF